MTYCYGLTSLPDLSGLTALKVVNMEDCDNLELPAGLVDELKAKGVNVLHE